MSFCNSLVIWAFPLEIWRGGLKRKSLIMGIHVMFNWHLSKQGIHWLVSHNHISSLEQLEVTCFLNPSTGVRLDRKYCLSPLDFRYSNKNRGIQHLKWIFHISWRVLSLQQFTTIAGHRTRLPKAHIQKLLWVFLPTILSSSDRTWDDCTLVARRQSRNGMVTCKERTWLEKRKGNWSLAKFS